MKFAIHKGYFLIVSNRLVDLLGHLAGFNGKGSSKRAMGFALFPCIIVLRDLSHPMTKQWINHERIHIIQTLESLGLAFIYSQLEYLYARIFLRYSHMEAYRYECIEQEAYLNQHNFKYLENRHIFEIRKHIFHKRKFHSDEEYKVVIDR